MRWMQVAVCCGLVSVAGASSALAEPIAETQISEWIADLESPQYRLREDATQALIKAGQAAILPAAQAAEDFQSEAGWRALTVLEALALRGEEQAAENALQAMIQLGQKGNSEAAEAAATLQTRRFAQHHRQGVELLTGLGATFTNTYLVDASTYSSYSPAFGPYGGPAAPSGYMTTPYLVDAVEIRIAPGALPPPPIFDPPAILVPSADLESVSEPDASISELAPPVDAAVPPSPPSPPPSFDTPSDEVAAVPPTLVPAYPIYSPADPVVAALPYLITPDQHTPELSDTLILGETWRGSAGDLETLAQMALLQEVRVENRKLSAAELHQFAKAPSLRKVTFHDAEFPLAAVRALKKLQPELDLSAFGSAVLGVSGDTEAVPFRVEFVATGAGADRAGIKVGDQIVAVDGETIEGFGDLTLVIAGCKVGDSVRLRVLREGKPLDLEAVLGPRVNTY